MSSLELNTEIKNDVVGVSAYEKVLENKVMASVDRLQREGKMSPTEVSRLYKMNFKKLLGTVDKYDILTIKVKQIEALTTKLLANHLSSKKEGKEECPGMIKSCIYGCMGISSNIHENAKSQNIAKAVIDRCLKEFDTLAIIAQHPWDFAINLKKALIDNFKETMTTVLHEFTGIASGMDTPENTYKTGTSLATILLTLIPGAIGKSLLSIARVSGKLAMGTAKMMGGTTLKTVQVIQDVGRVGEAIGGTAIGLAKGAAKGVAKDAIGSLTKPLTKSLAPITSKIPKTLTKGTEHLAEKGKEVVLDESKTWVAEKMKEERHG